MHFFTCSRELVRNCWGQKRQWPCCCWKVSAVKSQELCRAHKIKLKWVVFCKLKHLPHWISMWCQFWRPLRSCNKMPLNTPQWPQGCLSPMSCGKLTHSDHEEAQLLWYDYSWKKKKTICRNFIITVNNSVWEQHHLVEKAEDTPDWVCQGGMFSMERCTEGLVSFALRGAWMEEKVEKEKGFGVFIKASIVMCCGGSFMNECIMYSKTKRWDTKQYRKLFLESRSLLLQSWKNQHSFLITSKVHLSNSTPLSMFEMLASS